MLQGYPTKGGTGISIFGNYGDLRSLYSTVHEIANSLDEYNERLKAQHLLLMNFAYEIRKAYSGNRLTDKLVFEGDDKEMHYYGFNCVWTDILIFIATLRYNAGYIQTGKLYQANLYMLEYVVEKAMFDYNSQGANEIQHFIGQRINITNKYAFIIYQALHIKFVSERSGKKRFRSIPHLIGDHFSEWRQEYKDLIHSFELSAKEQKCEITDLEFNNFPDIKW
ncbi:hypothetical protein L21SP5_03614 [Salinivirga cyanobacteriivorans]|uniref:Uncharacterized protein n=1 Tax=Salinivirga cyanobacteriivorans TaxID=1307839 RepID=A0A0S2I4G3_9BACT|nr:hypothetical protein [Salinivirga cyanobacteriivorans]ALO17217.1 hypothetical protein L21SP5_03614 [Salinivirga cyanobacteriivorans]